MHTAARSSNPSSESYVDSFVHSLEGQRHSEAYLRGAKDAGERFEAICRAADRGEDVTDRVLLGLIPHANTASNRERGAWIHVAPVVTKDMKQWFEGAHWARPEDWPETARLILGFCAAA